MEAAHGVEIGGERIAVSCFELFDEGLHVGGDNLFRGLPWLRLFGVFANGGDGADGGLHGVSSLALAVAFHAMRGMYLHAERLLAKAGGSKCKERGITHSCSASEAGAERAERSEGLHKRSAEAWGHPLWARGAELPLAAFAWAFQRSACSLRQRGTEGGRGDSAHSRSRS